MSITRITEYQAKPGLASELVTRLGAILPAIERSAGCHSCQLLQSRDDPGRILVIEAWDSEEAHQVSVKNIPPRLFQDAAAVMAGPPRGAYYG